MNEDSGRIVRNATYILAGSMVADIAAFLFRLVVARGFGPEGFGLFSLALMTVGVGTSLALVGLPNGIVTFISRYRGQGDPNRIAGVLASSFAVAGAAGIVVAASLWVSAPTIAAGLFSEPELSPLLRTFVLGIPARVVVALTAAVCLGYERGGRQSIVKRILPKLGTFGAAAAVVVVEGSLHDVITAYVLVLWASAAAGIGLAALSVRGTGIDGVTTETRELLGFSVPLLFSGFVAFFLNWTDVALIGYFMDSSDVGVYQAAFILGTNVAVFSGAIASALYPNFGTLIADNQTGVIRDRFYAGVRWTAILTMAPGAYLVMFPELSLGLLFGEEFAIAVVTLAVLVLGQLLASLLAISTEILKAAKLSRYIFATYAIALVVNVTLNTALIPVSGILGAAVATMTASVLANGLHYRRIRRRFGVRLPIRTAALGAVVAAVAGLATLPLRPFVDSVPMFIAHIAAFTTLYVCGLFVTKLVNPGNVASVLESWIT